MHTPPVQRCQYIPVHVKHAGEQRIAQHAFTSTAAVDEFMACSKHQPSLAAHAEDDPWVG